MRLRLPRSPTGKPRQMRNSPPAPWLTRVSIGLGVCFLAPAAPLASASELRIRTDLGPENSRRAVRRSTRYIVLHTTEGGEAGSLRKLWRLGEAHYFVHRDGRVVRLLDRSRTATHAGDSLWDGGSRLDDVSLGIEVSGYHDHELSRAQTEALRELLRQLQGLYGIKDEDVLTHSMVAYGEPNRFHPYRHRGRKRCAMVFARPALRRKIGLTSAPASDPDVRAGRLRVGDQELERKLYPSQPATLRASAQPDPQPRKVLAAMVAAEPKVEAPSIETQVTTSEARLEAGIITAESTAWSIAGRAYSSPKTLYVFPNGVQETGDAIERWDDMPAGTRVLIDGVSEGPADAAPSPQHNDGLVLVSKGTSAHELIGAASAADSTTYIFPNGSVNSGAVLNASAEGRRQLGRLPRGTRVLIGYVNAGRLTSTRSLAEVAGHRWSEPSTYYRLPGGGIRAGGEVEASRLPQGTLVFFPQEPAEEAAAPTEGH